MNEIIWRLSLERARMLREMILFRERAAGYSTMQQRECFAMFRELQTLIADAERDGREQKRAA